MGYTVGGVEYSFDSTTNQRIMDMFVNREVMCCMTQEVEFMLKMAIGGHTEDNPLDEDDYYATFSKVCPDCGTSYGFTQISNDKFKCDDCGKVISADEYENLDDEPQEIFEWWAVTRWLGEKLSENGCVVIDSYGKAYWGRQTTGQAIALDGVIARICYKMQILEGQQFSWEHKI